MSDPTPNTAGVANQAVAVDAATAANNVQSDAKKVNLNTRVSNVDDLKTKAPEIWEAMIKALATTMINESHRQSDRIVRLMKEAERDSYS